MKVAPEYARDNSLTVSLLPRSQLGFTMLFVNSIILMNRSKLETPGPASTIQNLKC